MKLFVNIFLSSSPIKRPILQSAFSFTALLSHNLDICSSKFSLLSTSRPDNVTFFRRSQNLFIYHKLLRIFLLLFLSIIIALNFSVVTIMELSVKHCVAMFPSFSNSEISSFSELETQKIVLSSAKLVRSGFLIYMRRLFMNKLKKMGPMIEPCGTSDKSNSKIFYVLLTR